MNQTIRGSVSAKECRRAGRGVAAYAKNPSDLCDLKSLKSKETPHTQSNMRKTVDYGMGKSTMALNLRGRHNVESQARRTVCSREP
jgi:hypothetical protein